MLSWLIISHAFFLCRNPEHLQDEQLRSISDTHRFTAGVGINNMHVYSQQELTRQNIHEVSHRHKYNHPSSVPDSNLKKTLEQDCPSGVRRIHPQARNHTSLHMELLVILPILGCFSYHQLLSNMVYGDILLFYQLLFFQYCLCSSSSILAAGC